MTTIAPFSTPSRPTYSCIRCAERKVKCDRQRPCSACVRHNADCLFNLSKPPRKRNKRVKVQVLTDRLRHYEALLQEQGIDLGKLPSPSASEPHSRSSHTVVVDPEEFQSQTPSSIEHEPNRCSNKTRLVHGHARFKFLENTLWTRVVEESYNSENILEDSNDSSDLETSDNESGFMFSSQKKNSRPHHPPPERILQLWEIFTENIDPLTKVVHVPTLQPAIHKAVRNINTIPRSFEALMFAIYGIAIISLKDDECKQRFSEPRKTLLSRYTSGTEAALQRAKFMGTTSFVTLQALVLHLLSVRDIYEPRAVWTLTGVAVRIAQSMGLERDGVSLGLPPFDTEMRRRVWWQLKLHDFRAAELCGLAKFRDLDMGAESTKWPTNVNDDQLYPGMTSFVEESDTLTDVIFVVFRCELANFAAGRIATFRKQGKNSSHWNLDSPESDKADIEKAVIELEETLETKYLRYCDPSQPLHLLAMVVARYGMNVVRFLTHHPRRWASVEQTPPSERKMVWEVSIKLLEQQKMVHSNPMLKRFAWHAAYFRHWHAFIHVIDTLRADPVNADADKAWRLIGNTYENTPDMTLDMKKPVHVAVASLCLKAFSDREAALQNRDMHVPPTPDFILQLRQQRTVAKAKRQARSAKSSRPENLASFSQANTHDTSLVPEPDITYASDTSQTMGLQQSTSTNPPNDTQTAAVIENESFYLGNEFYDTQVGSLDMELDSFLAQDTMEESAAETITWEQWDAWLADSNVMRPLSS